MIVVLTDIDNEIYERVYNAYISQADKKELAPAIKKVLKDFV